MTEQAKVVDDHTAAHLAMLALMGKTATHLRDVHGIEPTDDKRENARLHAEAHGVDETHRVPWWMKTKLNVNWASRP